MIGRIKSVRCIEGYGFVTGDDGVDRFFHRDATVGMVLSDALVGLYAEFTPTIAPKGPRAVDVRLLSSTPAAGLPTGQGEFSIGQ